MPRILWQDGWHGGDLTDVVLAYEYPLAASRPFTEVETCFAGSSSAAPSLEVAKWSRRMGTVVTSAWSVWLVRTGRCWWCLVVTMRRCGSVTARLLSRPWPGWGFPGGLAFALTDDLESYFAGYRRLVRSFLVPWSW